MIEEVSGCIDYDECGAGPAIVLVPGSCSTGAAWRPIISDLSSRFRCVTTSLLGYGGTVERRTASDPSISHEAEVLESVVRKAGGPVHLVGHSFGGLVALVVALRNQVPLSSLVILEAPAMEPLRAEGEDRHHSLFRNITDAYFADFAGRNVGAIAAMIDFYGGPGAFASWPPRLRAFGSFAWHVDSPQHPTISFSRNRMSHPAIMAEGRVRTPSDGSHRRSLCDSYSRRLESRFPLSRPRWAEQCPCVLQRQ
jgi:pimeloyl-ACP methyl ester carboxylesterase